MSMTKFADVNNIRCFAFERDESKIFHSARLRLINQRRIFFSSIAIFHLFKPSIPMKHRETGRSKRTGNIRAIKTIKIVTRKSFLREANHDRSTRIESLVSAEDGTKRRDEKSFNNPCAAPSNDPPPSPAIIG